MGPEKVRIFRRVPPQTALERAPQAVSEVDDSDKLPENAEAPTQRLEVVRDRDHEDARRRERRLLLRERFPDVMPIEYVRSEYRTPSIEDLRECGYDVVELGKGQGMIREGVPAGIYIEHDARGADDVSVHTEAYHRFTDAERAMIAAIDESKMPVHVGRENPSARYAARISFLPEDLREGTLDSISSTHVQFGLQGRLLESSTFGGTHLVKSTPEVRRRAPIIRERAQNREMYPNQEVTQEMIAPLDQRNAAQIAAVVGYVLTEPSHDPVTFYKQMQGKGERSYTRQQLAQAVDRLRWHTFAAPTPNDPESKRRYDRMNSIIQSAVHTLELALNPTLEKAKLSADRLSEWEERTYPGSTFQYERREGYENAARVMDHMLDWSTQMMPLEKITSDNNLRADFINWKKRWAEDPLSSQARQELAQLNQTLRRWLENAVKYFSEKL